MLGIEIGLIGLLLGFHWLLSILAHRKLLENALSQVELAIQSLDMALGEAIEMVSSKATEGQNPLVGVLSQILMKNLEPPAIEAKVLQGDDGKFMKKKE